MNSESNKIAQNITCVGTRDDNLSKVRKHNVNLEVIPRELSDILLKNKAVSKSSTFTVLFASCGHMTRTKEYGIDYSYTCLVTRSVKVASQH